MVCSLSGVLNFIFFSFVAVVLVEHFCVCVAGAKTSNPAVTNLVWAARPPFAHKDGLLGEAHASLC